MNWISAGNAYCVSGKKFCSLSLPHQSWKQGGVAAQRWSELSWNNFSVLAASPMNKFFKTAGSGDCQPHFVCGAGRFLNDAVFSVGGGTVTNGRRNSGHLVVAASSKVAKSSASTSGSRGCGSPSVLFLKSWRHNRRLPRGVQVLRRWSLL